MKSLELSGTKDAQKWSVEADVEMQGLLAMPTQKSWKIPRQLTRQKHIEASAAVGWCDDGLAYRLNNISKAIDDD